MRSLVPYLLLLLWSGPALAGIVTISELAYDAPGSDDGKVFVELYGPAGWSLSGWSLVGVNGSGGGVTDLIDLSPFTIPADGFLVLADGTSAGTTSVAFADAILPDVDFQNGPDSLRLLEGASVVDALGYGTFGAGHVFAGEGNAVPGVGAGESLARSWANRDTDDNLRDFVGLGTPTPGWGPVARDVTAVPEPGTWLLMGEGLVLLALYSRRRKRSPASVATKMSPSMIRGAASERASSG